MLKRAIELIKMFEGFRAKPYLCPAGKATIGYGCTFYPNGKIVSLNDVEVSEEVASAMLEKLVENEFYNKIKDFVKANLNDNQWGAVISLTYNIGVANFLKSTLLKKININKDDKSIIEEFNKWINVKGKPNEGLKKRRKKESEIYFK